MQNLKILLIQEVHQQLKSFKFLVMILIVLLITPICGFIQVSDFAQRQLAYNNELRKVDDYLKNVFVYSQLQVPVLIAPNSLSIFSKGIEEKIGNKVIVSPLKLIDFKTTSQFDNPFLSIFSKIDVVGIIKLLSIFVILLTAGIISSEREEHTFKMIFVNNVSRFEYFLAKYLAVLISVLISLILIFFIISILVLLEPMIQTNISFWLKVLLIFFSSLLYLSIFIGLGLLISSKFNQSSTSILIGILLWISIVFVYPNTIYTIVHNLSKKTSITKFQSDINNIENTSIKEIFTKNSKSNIDNSQLNMPLCINFDKNDPENRILVNCYIPQLIGITEKSEFENTENQWKNTFNELPKSLRAIKNITDEQKRIALYFNNIATSLNYWIPDIIFEQLTSKTANTDYGFHEEYIRSDIEIYKSTINSYIKNKKGFGDQFFTQMPKMSWKDDYSSYSQDEIKIYSSLEEYPKLNLSDMPTFKYKTQFKVPIELYILAFFNIFLFASGYFIFKLTK